MAGKKQKPVKPEATPNPAVEEERDDSGYDPEIDSLPAPSKPVAAAAPPTPAEKPTPPQDPETGRFIAKNPAHPAHLVRRATQLGMSAEEQDIPTAELRETIRDLQDEQEWNIRRRSMENYIDGRTEGEGGPVGPQDTFVKDASVPPRPASPTPQDEEDFSLHLTREKEEEISPVIVELFRFLETKIKAMDAGAKKDKNLIGALKYRAIAQDESTRAGMLDSAFDALGKQFEKQFGSGPGAEFKQDSAEMQRRMAIISAAKIDWSKGPAHVKQQIKRAAELIYPPSPDPYTEVPEVPKNGAHELTDEQKRWTEGQLQRPTQRDTGEPKGTRLAEKNVARKLRELNIAGGDEEESLPG